MNVPANVDSTRLEHALSLGRPSHRGPLRRHFADAASSSRGLDGARKSAPLGWFTLRA
jgi:hypothetical protein